MSYAIFFLNEVFLLYAISLFSPLLTTVSTSQQSFDCHLNVSGEDTLQFDFSRISQEGWIKIDFESGGSLYLSLCNIPRGIESQCSNDKALVCVKKGSGSPDLESSVSADIADAGSVITSSTYLEESNEVTFVLEGSTKCNEEKNYTTILSLQCSETNHKPELIRFDDCEIIILWKTSAGCPIQEVVVNDTCILAQNSRSYDLRSLRHDSGYTVHGKNGNSYLLNICGTVIHQNCPNFGAVNELKPDKSCRVLSVTTSSQLKYSLHHGLSLEYKNVKGNGKTVFSFKCSEGTTEPIIEFESQDIHLLKFTVKTTVACFAPSEDCIISNSDLTYDLSVLHKHSGNWEIEDPKTKLKYFLNICGGLNSVPGVSCTGGSVASCLWDPKTHKGISLGVREMKPSIDRRDTISLKYTNGAPCGNGKTHSLNIKLLCSLNHHDPKIIPSDSKCEHNIVWNTNAACPLKFVRGKNCQFTEIYDNYNINLNVLHNSEVDYETRLENGEVYRTNLCGSLIQQCKGEEGVTVCWKNSEGKQYAIGKYNEEPVFSNGALYFKLEGEPCHENATKSIVKFEINCHYLGTDTEPKFIMKDKECQFFFQWDTSAACFPNQVSKNCRVESEGLSYDLSPLINPTSNHRVNVSEEETIFLNVCHSVIPEEWVFCRRTSAVCLVNKASPSSVITRNLGMIYENNVPVVENGELKLRYSSGDVCKSGVSGSYSTTITFICDWNEPYSNPVLNDIENCGFKINWRTRAACPQKNTNEHFSKVIPTVHSTASTTVGKRVDLEEKLPVITTKDSNKNKTCTVLSPLTNTVIDLSPLRDKGNWYVKGVKGMLLAVCRPLSYSSCPGHPSSGICCNEGFIIKNLGNANEDLRYINGEVSLTYSSEGYYSAKINFRCGKEDTGPELLLNDSYTTLISWQTPLVCHDELSKLCCRGNDTPLCQLNGNFKLEVGDKLFFLSVCQPLGPITSVPCPKGSSACMATYHRGSYINETNIGFPFSSPKINADNSVTLEYFNGDICHAKRTQKYSTSIQFVCDETEEKGHPEYVEGHEICHFRFKWRSKLLCMKTEEKFSPCSVAGSKITVPLKVLSQFQNRNTTFKVNSRHFGSTFRISLCSGKLKECEGDICIHKQNQWHSFGIYDGINMSSGDTVLHYRKIGKSPNPTGIQVHLKCGNHVGGGQPQITKENDDELKIIWESEMACLNDLSIPEQNLPEGSSSMGIVLGISVAVIVLIIGIPILIWKFFRRRTLNLYGQFRYSKDRRRYAPSKSLDDLSLGDNSINDLLL